MDKRRLRPREGWQRIVEEQGLVWHTQDGKPYWDESGCYVFTLKEIETLERAAERCHELFLEAGDHLAKRPEKLARFGIPDWCIDPLLAEWKRDRPALDYGRFDFGWDGKGEPKLFEYNCDTPTAMLECGVVQWQWKEEVFPANDQFTSLHDKLIDRWRYMARDLPGQRLWVTHYGDELHEDTLTATYMRDLAEQAGLETRGVLIDRIGIDGEGRIVDDEDYLITAIFKLYPWEWIVAEDYGREIVRRMDATLWLEPIWKMLWSNKAILPLLSELEPKHPNLLPASWDPVSVGSRHVAKPILAREGANIVISEDGRETGRTDGPYTSPVIYQQLYDLPEFDGAYPVLGVWTVGGEAAGLGIREGGRITGDEARFVPHIIEG
ncbi:glutathionylspermidine synthase family protein [Sphingomonas swuensis]|uniref:Glutathionylspermidine synthase family protein n=1 Tax=Sphingomonas swuensis TaxID=977800 RepID=A0ABP7SYG7_9SPHN